MNVSTLSNIKILPKVSKMPVKPVAAAGIAAAACYISKPEEKETSSKNNIFKDLKLMAQTAIGRISYFKNNQRVNDAVYNEDMLNDILNDTVAKLNGDIYKPVKHEINGFKPIYSAKDEKTGFSATAYKQDNEIFITYCGTNNKQAVKSDFQMAFGKLPEQFEHAEKFYQEVKEKNPDSEITFIGHSLGGSLAQLMSCKYKNVPAITLNAFGVDTIVQRNKNEFKNNHNVYNFIIDGDFVSNTSKHIGKTVMLDKTYSNYHDMPNYLNRWA